MVSSPQSNNNKLSLIFDGGRRTFKLEVSKEWKGQVKVTEMYVKVVMDGRTKFWCHCASSTVGIGWASKEPERMVVVFKVLNFVRPSVEGKFSFIHLQVPFIHWSTDLLVTNSSIQGASGSSSGGTAFDKLNNIKLVMTDQQRLQVRTANRSRDRRNNDAASK